MRVPDDKNEKFFPLAVLLLPFGNEQPEASYGIFTVVIILYLRLSVRNPQSHLLDHVCILILSLAIPCLLLHLLLIIFEKLIVSCNKYLGYNIINIRNKYLEIFITLINYYFSVCNYSFVVVLD